MTKIRQAGTPPDAPKGVELFQAGGIVSEEDLFNDLDDTPTGAPVGSNVTSPLDGEMAPADPPPADPPAPADGIVDLGNQNPQGGPQDLDAPADPPADAPPAPLAPADVTLSGIEQFLTGYGVQGGMITYEDGTSSRFDELDAAEQANILSSLVQNSVPSVEEKYNLEDAEIDLLNTVRESGRSVEDFINDMVDHRVKTLSAQQQMESEDFEKMPDDAIFVRHYMANNPEATNDEIAQELVNAKELNSFSSTVGAIRNSFVNNQKSLQSKSREKEEQLFNQELEAQRSQVVQTVEDINDIAGARVTDEMKEYLLHDIMELNDNKDPILMEKIFSTPESMFKASWFANYGEDYITNLNEYYKKEISKARKAGYNEAVSGMPGNPTIIPGGGRGQQRTQPGQAQGGPGVSFGRELTEEDLFDLENE